MASSSAPDLRASDADRERVVAALRDHVAAGRLEAGELEERVGAALRARTRGELAPLLADLPGRRRPSRRRHRARRPPAVFVAVGLLLLEIWAAAGAHEPFWPAWPLLGMAIWTLTAGGSCGKAWRRGPRRTHAARP